MIRATLLAFLWPLAAWAGPDLRAADIQRLADFDRLIGPALLGALQGGAPEDVAILTAALAGAPQPPAPNGDWDCRTIKMGRAVPLAAYTPFRCRITQTAPTEWQFEKLTGSQRTRGTIYLRDGQFVYAGAGHVGDAPAADYADIPAAQKPIEPNQTIPEIALFEQSGPDRARLLFPAPILDSAFDVLSLTR